MIGILFVDDRRDVLDALGRVLRSRRDEWDAAFVTSGAEALEVMSERRFEVVVSDMQMPEMDGADFLARVRDRHPETVRIVLSGQACLDGVMRLVGPAHQFLAKPCEPIELMQTIERALSLRRVLSSERLIELVSGIGSLPTLPSLYRELVGELQSPTPSLARVADVIERDVAMSAKILNVVNSAFFGLRREVATVQAATTFLGVDTIATLVLASSVFDQLPAGEDEASLEALWESSLLTSRGAEAIARIEGFDERLTGCAATAGMLRDVGDVILRVWLPDEHASILEREAAGGGSRHRIEAETLGATHGRIGAYLLGLWGLPDPIVEAVAFHSWPSDAAEVAPPAVDVRAVVHGAEAIVAGRAGAPPQLDEAYLEAAGGLDRIGAWTEAVEACTGAVGHAGR